MRQVAVSLVVILAAVIPGCTGGADGDLLTAEQEEEGWVVDVRYLDGTTATWRVTSNPRMTDTDQDGVDDFVESLERTDPRKPDTDDDGLIDGEDRVLHKDSRLARRWMAAGLQGIEENGSVRFLGERGTPTLARGGLPRDQDTDKDGLSDGEEAGGYVIVVGGQELLVKSSVYLPDSDGDGYSDAEERSFGTHPGFIDTDGDGVSDSGDVDPTRNVRVRFVVDAFSVSANHAGATVWVDVFGLDPAGFLSDLVTLEGQEPADPHALDSGVLDPRDDGGSVKNGRFNVTFLVSVYRETGNGSSALLDVISDDSESANVAAQVDVRNGNLAVLEDGAPQAWPADGSFSGPDGSIAFHIELVD